MESVAWISERKDVLCAPFFLLTIISYIKYTDGSKRRLFYGISLISFILSLMSKPMAVSLPVILLLFDFFPLNRLSSWRSSKSAALEKLPFFLLGAIASLVTISVQDTEGFMLSLDEHPMRIRILNAICTYVLYLIKMFLPLNLAPYYPFPEEVSLFTIGLAVSFVFLTGLAFLTIRYNKAFLIACLYYTITLLPVIGIIQVGQQSMADRYTYLPSLGLFFLAGLGIGTLFDRSSKGILRITIAALIIVFGIFVSKTLKQTTIWHDSISLWTYQIKHYPGMELIYHNRGGAYYDIRDYHRAIADYNKAIELDPEYLFHF